MFAMTLRPSRGAAKNTAGQVLFASLIGTTIEFFDFYIYATAAVLVFPRLFLPEGRSDVGDARVSRDVCDRVLRAAVRIGAFRTFRRSHRAQSDAGRGAAHDGDLNGRDRSASDLCERRSRGTDSPGSVPPRPRLGLGGEWGGAVLLAIENAPPRPSRVVRNVSAAWCANRILAFWRDFSLLVEISIESKLFHLRLADSLPGKLCAGARWTLCAADDYRNAGFRAAQKERETVRVPMFEVFRSHTKMLVVGTLSSIATFVLFYLMTVFALSWGTTALHYSRDTFLVMQLAAMIFFAITIPLSAKLAEHGRRRTLIWVTSRSQPTAS